MAVTVETFLAGNPEFTKTQQGLIAAKLAEAVLEVDPIRSGTLTDTIVSYLTAHKLALSPFGQNARMVAKDGTTTYWTHYKRLVGIVGGGSGFVP